MEGWVGLRGGTADGGNGEPAEPKEITDLLQLPLANGVK